MPVRDVREWSRRVKAVPAARHDDVRDGGSRGAGVHAAEDGGMKSWVYVMVCPI
jgi:hypothetical protein